MAPLNMRAHLCDLIDAETEAARAGRPSGVWAKMNSLVDPDIIDKLYEASAAGVPIELLLRGSCCLRPGVAGLSETIRGPSLVGRFPEHWRDWHLANGAIFPPRAAKLYNQKARRLTHKSDNRAQ